VKGKGLKVSNRLSCKVPVATQRIRLQTQRGEKRGFGNGESPIGGDHPRAASRPLKDNRLTRLLRRPVKREIIVRSAGAMKVAGLVPIESGSLSQKRLGADRVPPLTGARPWTNVAFLRSSPR